MTYELQLKWIQNLQAGLRSFWMDGFFKAWGLVDTIYFSALVVTLVWYLWDRSIGIRLFYILVISAILNKLLKGFFHEPRPCHIDPLVGILCNASPGLPSGAAQKAAIFCGLIFIECRGWLYRSLALIFALFLCFSRVYLGEHYPSDVLGGLAVGGFLLLVYKKLFPLCEKRWKTVSLSFSFLLGILGLFFFESWILYLFFLTLGVVAGLLSYGRLKIPKARNLWRRGMQVIIVIGGLSIFFMLEKILPGLGALWSFAGGYWLSFLGGWLVLCKLNF